MLLQPTIVTSITHPLVASAFVKHRFNTVGGRRRMEEVLVLDAHPVKDLAGEDVQAAILADMDMILDQIQRRAISVDSIEIRMH
jgi:hypothetical protein